MYWSELVCYYEGLHDLQPACLPAFHEADLQQYLLTAEPLLPAATSSGQHLLLIRVLLMSLVGEWQVCSACDSPQWHTGSVGMEPSRPFGLSAEQLRANVPHTQHIKRRHKRPIFHVTEVVA
ncbi:hypothetical protein DV515_00000755 [Chloebia gouldiae]|uniref:Uncharacterized protein n=1 Tax=Chloebia gouldiae TaxID=44316 RepID=A0A3L8SZE9_CHLGU|nr:hypothetical protein DV515_00000755 [Chloebia gouldiae]